MDVVLVGIIVGFIAGGWRTGFLERLIGLGFIALSFVASAYLRYPIGAIAGAFSRTSRRTTPISLATRSPFR